MKILETPRLALRTLEAEDSDLLSEVLCDPEVMQFSNGVLSQSSLIKWIEEYLEQHRNWGFSPYAIVRKEPSKVIGYCGLFHIPDICGKPEVEIGYRLAKATWGNGLATEAALAVRDYAFNKLSLNRLIAMIDPNNSGSVNVAKKIGMRYEKDVMFEGYTHPDHVYVVEKGATLLDQQ